MVVVEVDNDAGCADDAVGAGNERQAKARKGRGKEEAADFEVENVFDRDGDK